MTPPRPAPGLPGLASPLRGRTGCPPRPGSRDLPGGREGRRGAEAASYARPRAPRPELRLSAVLSGAGPAPLPRPGVTSAAAAQSPLQLNN